MTAIAKKAAELKTKVAAQKSEKAAKLADNLKKVKGQDVAVVAEKGAKTALKNPTVLKAAKAAKESTDKVVKPAPAKKAAKAAKKSSEPKTEQTWTFVKNGPASGQRLVILETLKGKLGGKATRTKLAEALSKVVESSQDANTILSLKKKFLVDNGCIKIS